MSTNDSGRSQTRSSGDFMITHPNGQTDVAGANRQVAVKGTGATFGDLVVDKIYLKAFANPAAVPRTNGLIDPPDPQTQSYEIVPGNQISGSGVWPYNGGQTTIDVPTNCPAGTEYGEQTLVAWAEVETFQGDPEGYRATEKSFECRCVANC